MNEVTIPRAIVNRLLAHAQQGGEAEICGMIGARKGEPESVYPVPNVSPDPGRRFAMEPLTQSEAMRQMREAGETLFAIYHSPPHAPAAPSATDLAEVAYPEALYLIISLNTQGVLEMQGFRISAEQVSPVPLALG